MDNLNYIYDSPYIPIGELKQDNNEQVNSVEWSNETIKFLQKTLQSVRGSAESGLMNDFDYLVEGSMLVLVPQIATCEKDSLEIFVANPLKDIAATTFFIMATPITTLEEPPKSVHTSSPLKKTES